MFKVFLFNPIIKIIKKYQTKPLDYFVAQDEYTLLQIILQSLENQLKCLLAKELQKMCHVFL